MTSLEQDFFSYVNTNLFQKFLYPNVKLPYHQLVLLSTLGQKTEISLRHAITQTIISDNNSRRHHNLFQTVLTRLYHLHGSRTDRNRFFFSFTCFLFKILLFVLILHLKILFNNLKWVIVTPQFNPEKSQHKRLATIHNTRSMLKPLYSKNSYI